MSARSLVAYSCYILGLIFVAYLLQQAWPELETVLPQARPGWILLSTLAFFAHTLMACWMLHKLLVTAGVGLGMRETSRIYYLSQMAKYVPGVVWWFAMQASLLKSENAVRKVVFANMRLMLLVSAAFILFSLALLSLFWGPSGWLWSLLLVALCVLALHLLNGFHFVHGLPAFIRKRLPAALLEEIRPTVMSLASLFCQCLGQFALYLLTILGMIFAFYDMPLMAALQLAAYQCLAWVAGVLSVVVPAGMGVREAVFLLLGSAAQQFSGEQLQSLAVITRSLQIMQEALFSVVAVVLVRARLL